jgi:O-antigen ligase
MTNACLILLLIPALAELKPAIAEAKSRQIFGLMKLIMTVLALPICAVIFSQFLRQAWLFKACDGPARILLAIPLLIYFSYKQIDFSKLISICAAPALLIVIPVVLMHPEISAKWDNRFATASVDPTQFGTYILVLTSFCLFSIDNFTAGNIKSLAIQISGIFAGLFLLVGTGTRGSWLGIPFLLFAWLILNRNKLPKHTILILMGMLFGTVVLIGLLQPAFLDRLFSGFAELSMWLDHTNRETSAGFRLTMWQMSWELFKHSPLYGYGDGGFAGSLNQPWITSISSPETRNIILFNGPHNEFLANLLRSGFLGGVSVIALFFIPLIFFWKNRHNTQARQASHFGIAFIVCLMVCSLSSEVLTMKFTASFYGLIITGLTAQIMSKQTRRS